VLRYLDNAYIERMGRADLQHLVGRKLTEIAEERGIGVVDAMFDIFRDDRMEPFILLRSKAQSDETNAERILKSPAAIVGISDGGAHLQTFSGADYPTYFLSHWVRDKRAFTIEEGVAALTGRAAEFVGLIDRGTLEIGKAADITIFDPDTIASEGLEILDFPGGGSRLRKNAAGIPHVIVNGVPIIENGALTGAVPGKMIRA
jgi:N-acyl-D-aspartate/D-glutamate deacylase